MTTKLEILHQALTATEYNLSEWTRWDPEEERKKFLKQIEDLNKQIVLEERK